MGDQAELVGDGDADAYLADVHGNRAHEGRLARDRAFRGFCAALRLTGPPSPTISVHLFQ
jgi:hypothetical protein